MGEDEAKKSPAPEGGENPPPSHSEDAAAAEPIAGITEQIHEAARIEDQNVAQIIDILNTSPFKDIYVAPAQNKDKEANRVRTFRVVLMGLLELKQYSEQEIPVAINFLRELFDVMDIGVERAWPRWYADSYQSLFQLVDSFRKRYATVPKQGEEFSKICDELLLRLKNEVARVIEDLSRSDTENIAELITFTELMPHVGLPDAVPALREKTERLQRESVLALFRKLSTHPEGHGEWPNESELKAKAVKHAAEKLGVTLPLQELQNAVNAEILVSEQALQGLEAHASDEKFAEWKEEAEQKLRKPCVIFQRASHFPEIVLRKTSEETLTAETYLQEIEMRIQEASRQNLSYQLEQNFERVRQSLPGKIEELKAAMQTFLYNWDYKKYHDLTEAWYEQLSSLCKIHLPQELGRVAKLMENESKLDVLKRALSRLEELMELFKRPIQALAEHERAARKPSSG